LAPLFRLPGRPGVGNGIKLYTKVAATNVRCGAIEQRGQGTLEPAFYLSRRPQSTGDTPFDVLVDHGADGGALAVNVPTGLLFRQKVASCPCGAREFVCAIAGLLE
jgi:hypothetical protein